MEKQHKITMTVVMDEGEREVVLTFPPRFSGDHIQSIADYLYDANEVTSEPVVELADG